MSKIPTLRRVDGVLYIENVNLLSIGDRFGTPLYIYSRAAIENRYNTYVKACIGYLADVHYAVKANSNLAVLNLLARLGAGFDIVSGGELARVLAAGGQANRIVFSGVGKSVLEIQEALRVDIRFFNVESVEELERLDKIAQQNRKRARVCLRINPSIDTETHPYISTGLRSSKFGIAYEMAYDIYRRAQTMRSIDIVGIDCHIGSQITSISPYLNALDKILSLIEKVEKNGIMISCIDIGGGLGIRYDKETPPDIHHFVTTLLEYIKKRGHGHRKVILEPGRSLIGNAGIILTRVEYLKPGEMKNFAIIDAGMNDLIRPAIYSAYHEIEVVRKENRAIPPTIYDIVGPVCESGDWLGLNRNLSIETGDLLAIGSAGAYGFSMSSNYNTRPRAAEILVDNANVHVARHRETISSLFENENILSI